MRFVYFGVCLFSPFPARHLTSVPITVLFQITHENFILFVTENRAVITIMFLKLLFFISHFFFRNAWPFIFTSPLYASRKYLIFGYLSFDVFLFFYNLQELHIAYYVLVGDGFYGWEAWQTCQNFFSSDFLFRAHFIAVKLSEHTPFLWSLLQLFRFSWYMYRIFLVHVSYRIGCVFLFFQQTQKWIWKVKLQAYHEMKQRHLNCFESEKSP